MDAKERYDLVDRFLRNELNDSELQRFNEALSSNSLLQQELADQKMLNEIIFSSEIKEIQNQVKTDVDQLLNKNTFSKWYTVSLIALSIIAAGLLIYPSEKIHKASNITEAQTPETGSKEISINQAEKKEMVNTSTPSQEKITGNQVERTLQSSETDEMTVAVPEPESEKNVQENNTTSVSISGSKETTLPVGELKEPENTANVAPEVEDKCPHKTLYFNVQVEHEHNGKYDGKVSVSTTSIEGVQEPLLYQLTELSNGFDNESSFSGLESSLYHLKVKDANGCVINNQSVIEVKQLHCNETTEYLLNTQYDESIDISLITPATAIQVRDKTGTLIWEANEFANENYNWNGRNNNGDLVQNGLYLYSITNDNKSTCLGSITVIRN